MSRLGDACDRREAAKTKSETASLRSRLAIAEEALEKALKWWGHCPFNHDYVRDENRCEECNDKKIATSTLKKIKEG